MVDRPARVVATIYGQAGRSISRPASANPKGRGIFPPVPAAMISAVPMGTTLAHRLDPDENLLRQNASI
jgi:hypothetical protein